MVVEDKIQYDSLNEEEREQAMYSYLCLMSEIAEYGDEDDIIWLNKLLNNEEFAIEMLKTETFYRSEEGYIFVN